MPSPKKNAWSESGYARPRKGDEHRVAAIASAWESLSTDGMKAARKELKKLIEEGKLRIGYQDWAKRLRLRMKKYVPSK
jgi:hypothetical protein